MPAIPGTDATSIMMKKMANIGVGEVVGIAAPFAFGVMDYQRSREEGNGKIVSLAKAVGEGVMSDVIGWKGFMGLQLVEAVPKMAISTAEAVGRQARTMSNMSRNLPFQNANFMDSQQAFTMRQAGMQLAKASKYNTQQAMLGNEAQYMHM